MESVCFALPHGGSDSQGAEQCLMTISPPDELPSFLLYALFWRGNMSVVVVTCWYETNEMRTASENCSSEITQQANFIFSDIKNIIDIVR